MKTIDFIIVATTVIALELIGFSYASSGGQNQTIKKMLSFGKNINCCINRVSTPAVQAQAKSEKYRTVKKPSNNTTLYLKDDMGNYVSLFHDVPLITKKTNCCPEKEYNMVVEMFRGTSLKSEISLTKKLNPIMKNSDTSWPIPNGSLPWNLGKLPQTWEDSTKIDSYTKLKGGGGQVVVLEIGNKTLAQGQVIAVKLLAAFVTTNRKNQTEWIVMAIAADEENVDKKYDVLARFGNIFSSIKTWLETQMGRTIYGPSEPVKASTVEIAVKEKYKQWQDMWKNKQINTVAELSLVNTTLKNSTSINQEEAHNEVQNN